MLSKESIISPKELVNNKANKTKQFMKKLKHHRHQSVTIPTHFQYISPKNLFYNKEVIDKKSQPRSSLFNISSNSLQQLSSYGTSNKSKINNDTKEKKKEKNNSKKQLFVLNEIEMDKLKDAEKIQKTRRRKSKSQKLILSEILRKKENQNKEINDNNDENIISNTCDKAENYIILPDDLNKELQNTELNVVSPNRNIEGNYSYYINGVANSLKQFIEFDYDSIFAPDNQDNVRYLYYMTPMDIEDCPKKKLLIIDLDETLIHSEFRNQDNYKILDDYTKNSKCQNKTFSYSDENSIYFFDVFFRPYLKEFLTTVSKYFDLAIFTAAVKGYADIILDYIDPRKEFFQFRLYRDACIPIQQRLYIKDLRIIKDYDPKNVILMDNSLYSFMNQPSNGMLVNSFYTNHKDTQLISAKNYLVNHILPCEDVRKECEKWYHFTKLFYKGTSKEIKED